MSGSGADLEYQRLLARSGQSTSAGLDGARLSQLEDSDASSFVAAIDTNGNPISGYHAKVVFDANGDVDDIILEAI